MAKSKAKSAKAGSASAVAAASPYVQRLIQDEQLRGDLKSAFDSARVAYGRFNNGKAPTQLLDDKKLQKELSNAANSLRSASEALRAGPKRRKRRSGGGLRRLVLVAIVGGIAAVALSEGVRNKVLDALFGAEEEFDYQSTTVPAPPPPTPAATGS